ncbi:hypothetical protein [Oceanobacillus kapialis]|uniref:Uncharacterized protein n=1 Tax=Oceanobacillus kapialis TaxID=481353 RepID=A0ABW5Q323_9BACI
MNKRLNIAQALLTALFVMIILAAYQFLIPDFSYKSIFFIVLCGLSAYIGGILSLKIIKE